MKTIAITIEEDRLVEIDQLGKVEGRNRSDLIREAVDAYLAAYHRMQDEEKERRVFRRLLKRLQDQADAMIGEQADL